MCVAPRDVSCLHLQPSSLAAVTDVLKSATLLVANMVYNFTNNIDSWAQPQGYLREICKSDMQCQKYRPEVLHTCTVCTVATG